MGKGEIARYQQFLLCPQCFLKTCIADMFGKGLKQIIHEKAACWKPVNLNFLPDDKILDQSKLKQTADK